MYICNTNLILKKMKKVLRLEHADGSGIFTRHINGDYREYDPWSIACHGIVSIRHESFLNPYKESDQSDTFNFIEGIHFCAYKSVSQFSEWIKEGEFSQYYQHGIRAYILELSDWYEGIDQIMFKKEDIISKKDVSELFI